MFSVYIVCKFYIEKEIADAHITKEGHIPCPCRHYTNNFDKNDTKNMINNMELLIKFDRFVEAELVAEDPLCFWCPNASCSSIVKIGNGKNDKMPKL